MADSKQELSDSSYAKFSAANPVANSMIQNDNGQPSEIKDDNGQPSEEYLELCSSNYDKIPEDLTVSKKSDHIYLMPTEIQEPGVPHADYNLSDSLYEKPVRIVRPLGFEQQSTQATNKPEPLTGNLVNGCGDPSISSHFATPGILQLPKNSTSQSKRSKRPLVITCVILTVVIILSAIVGIVIYINEKDKSDANTKQNNLSGSSTNLTTSKGGMITQTATGTLTTTLETSLASTTPGTESTTPGTTMSSLTTTPSISTTSSATSTTSDTTTSSATVTTSSTLSKTTVQTPNVSTSDLYRDCKELKLQGYHTSGVYNIYPYLPKTTVVRVYCDMTTDGGGWTVFQHRKDGTENFYVDWTNYKSGFGDPAGEYWLGNDHLHHITALGTSELYVRLEKFSGGWFYAKYKEFMVASETDKYRMRLKVGSYQGNAGDSIESHGTTNTNGHRFSTRDVDNDDAQNSCAVARKGAWWYNICTWANLNGDYGNGICVSAGNCNFWYSLTNSFSGVKTSFMMVRRS